jgi:hypothetical protein
MAHKTKTRHSRRTKLQMTNLRESLYEICRDHHPLTVRNAYYLAVTKGLIEKTQAEYKAVGRLLVAARREGTIPWDWIVDGSRMMRKPATHRNLRSFLELSQETYRRAVWLNQKVDVEIWCESNSIAGVLYSVTSQWDVPLMPCGGYPSATFLFEAGSQLATTTWPNHIFYFGDFDPSGKDITRHVEKELRGFAPDAEIHFEAMAVTEEQIHKWKLPSSPVKTTDSRSKGFKGQSVEIESIEPEKLRDLCEGCITEHIDDHAFKQLQIAEAAERTTLSMMIEEYVDVA